MPVAIPEAVAGHLRLYGDPGDILGAPVVLGAPVGAARPAGPSRWGTAGVAQRFERGVVVAVPGRPALLIAGRLLRLYEGLGGCTGELGFPLTGALRTVTALPGDPLRGHGYQLFEGPGLDGSRCEGSGFGGSGLEGAGLEGAGLEGADFDGPRFVGSRFDGPHVVGSGFVGSGRVCAVAGLPACGAIGVSPDGATAAVAVGGPIWAGYCGAGGFDGRLGFPVDAARTRAARAVQEFQGGVVLWSEAHGVHTVTGAVWDRIGGDAGLDEVGWPVGGQQPSPDDDDPLAYQQEFEHALVTVRDGIARLWRG